MAAVVAVVNSQIDMLYLADGHFGTDLLAFGLAGCAKEPVRVRALEHVWLHQVCLPTSG